MIAVGRRLRNGDAMTGLRAAVVVGILILSAGLVDAIAQPRSGESFASSGPAGGMATTQANSTTQPGGATLDELAASLGRQFRRYHSAHFEVLADADAGTVRRVLELSEDTLRAVAAFAGRLGLTWRPPAVRMAIVLFERYADYARFGRRAGFVTDENVPGYFDERAGTCALFNVANASLLRARRDGLWRLERELAAAKERGEAARSDRASELDRQVESARREIASIERAILATVVRHEIAHQVMYHAGLQAPSMRGRRWLTEGLAMQFESADGANEYRLADALAVQAPGRLAVVRRVIGDAAALGPGAAARAANASAGEAYAAAWAVVYYLSQRQPKELAEYIASPPGGLPEMDAFERRFGEVNAEFVDRLYEFLKTVGQ